MDISNRLALQAVLLTAISSCCWAVLIWHPVGALRLATYIYAMASFTGIIAGLMATAIVVIQADSEARCSKVIGVAVLCGLTAFLVNILLWLGNIAQTFDNPHFGWQFDLTERLGVGAAVLIPGVCVIGTSLMAPSSIRLALRLGTIAIFWSPVVWIGHGVGVMFSYQAIAAHLFSDFAHYDMTAVSILITWLIMLMISGLRKDRKPSTSETTMDER